ncbi:hypothetical protein KR054_005104, partial [Drosophila jambulina]
HKMEPSARGPERAMRQYLAHALDTDCTRSAGSLDRFLAKKMNNFPPPSSLEAKASRCLLFEQLLSGGRRKQERLLVPDLATNWFRKQKVYVDKLSTKELADLSSGLATQNECYMECSCGCLDGRKPSEATEAQATQNANECVPLTEPKSRNPFLLNSEAATKDTNEGSCNERSSCSCLLQAMSRERPPSARQSEPMMPRLNRKYDLRKAPQRRLDPTAFRRISPEFFSILDAYETAMSASCPLYGISMHHWGETTESEKHPCIWAKEHFLGDDSVTTTAVVSPYRLPGLNRPPEERSEEEDGTQQQQQQQQEQQRQQQKQQQQQQQEDWQREQRRNRTSSMTTYSSGRSADNQSQLDSLDDNIEELQQELQKKAQQQQKQLKQQQQELQQQQQELQQQQEQLQQRQQQLEQTLGAEPQKLDKPLKKRRDWRNFFRQSPHSKYTMACINAFTPALPRLPATPSLPRSLSFKPASSSLRNPRLTPDSSFLPNPCLTDGSSLLPNPCLTPSASLPFFGGLTSICRRPNKPGQHLLYNLGTNFHQFRTKYTKKQHNKPKRRLPPHAEKKNLEIRLFSSKPPPCIWTKGKKKLRSTNLETEMQAEDSSTTLMPPLYDGYTMAGIQQLEEVPREEIQTQVHQEQEQQQVPQNTWQQEQQQVPQNTWQQEQQQVPQNNWQQEPPKIATEENIYFRKTPSERTLAGFAHPAIQRKQSTETDYGKCGYKPRAFYLANDYHQLMRRYAKPRASPGRQKRKKVPDQVPSATKLKPKDQCPARPKPVLRTQSRFKSLAKPKLPKRPTTAMAPKQRAHSPRPGNDNKPKMCNCRAAKPQKTNRRQTKKTLPDDTTSGSLGTCKCNCLAQAPVQAQSDVPSTSCQDTLLSSMTAEPSSFSSCQCAKQNEAPASSYPTTSTSCQPISSNSSLPGTLVPSCSQKIPSRKPSSLKKCVSNTQTATTVSVGPPRQPSPPRRKPCRSPSPPRKPERKPCCWQAPKRTPVVSKKPIRKRATSCDSSSSVGRTTPRERSSSGYRYRQFEASPASSFAPTECMAPGRRYYTDTQPGMAARAKFSCRSLHTTCSIRALSSNTDSVRCPCAPAPSVASVEPPPPAPCMQQAQHEPEEEQQQYYQYQEQHEPQMDMPEQPYLQQQQQQQQHQQQGQHSCPARPAPSAYKLFNPKPTLFKNTMRWEEHEHRYARTRLRTNRPPPPPRTEVYYVNANKWNSTVGWQGAGQRSNYVDYNNQNAFYYPQSNYQQWSHDPYYRGQQAYQTYPNVLGYQGQQQFANANGQRMDQDDAIAAAAQGLRGLVQALGGPRHKSKSSAQEREADQQARDDYSQEMMDCTTPSSCYNEEEEAMEPQTAYSYTTGTSSGLRGSDTGAFISFPSGRDFRAYPSTSQATRCDYKRHTRQTGGSSPVEPAESEEAEQQPVTRPTPLAIFLDELKARHDASSRSRPQQEARKVHTRSFPETSSSDDCADADDSLEVEQLVALHPPSAMLIPATYTGLLEEQVISEYLPRPRYKRRT